MLECILSINTMEVGLSRFVTLYLLLACCSSGNYNLGGIINGAQYATYFNFTVPEYTSSVACIFKVNNIPYSNTIMLASTTPITVSLTKQSLSELYSNQSSLLSSMDLFGAINGDFQLVNLKYSYANNNQVYMAFFNMDQPTLMTDKHYYLSLRAVASSGLICFSCPWYSTLGLNCQCSPCNANHYGKQCDYYIEPMNEDQQYHVTMYSVTNSYYRIDSSIERVKIVYSENYPTNSIKLYVQFQISPGDLAGQLNNYYDPTTNISLSKLVTTTESEFVVETKGRKLMVTLHSSSSSHSTDVAIRFQNADGKSKIGLIAGLVMGFVGLVILIILVVYCKKKRQTRMIAENSFYLSSKQISLYFPQVKGSIVLDYLKEISNNYDKLMVDDSEPKSQNEQGEQCMVCLDPITGKSTVRVTYCKHIFHSHCLTNWFSKNQNCPFCRHECNRDPSELAYARITQGRSKITANNLVKLILELDNGFRPKRNKAAEKEQPAGDSFDVEDAMEYSIQNNYDDEDSEESESKRSTPRNDSGGFRKKGGAKGKKSSKRPKQYQTNANEISTLKLNE